MGKIVAILGSSGDGKTTSTIINPDGTFNPSDYHGMDPKTHFILNLDRKSLPFPAGYWGPNEGNYHEPISFDEIKADLMAISKLPQVKSVAIDTVNIYLAMKEFNDRRKLTYDQWKDVAIA